MVKVWGVDLQVVVNFSVNVEATLNNALATLPVVDRSSKPKDVVIFSYDT